MKKFASLARTLENSLAAHSASCGEASSQQRKQDIRALPTGVNRTAAIILDEFAHRHRLSGEKLLNQLAQHVSNLDYLGNGAQATVYRRGDTAIKVYRRTVMLEEAERTNYRDSRQELCNKLGMQLGNVVVPQEFLVGDHPLGGGYRAVLGHQPYVAGDKLDLFHTNTLRLKKVELTNYCETHAGGSHELEGLVDATFRSHEAFHIVPDLNGVDNFRIVGNGLLRLIDVEPVHIHEHPEVHYQILRQAETLDRFLSAA